MTQAWCKLAAFSRDEKGASGIEYVLVAAIAVVAIAIFVSGSGVGARLTGILTDIGTNVGS
ncbi:MAG TPA: Flp family type IVb pilin [Vibrio sp.]|nr:Flp family type IVb pilin [Vibrio sp.]